MYYPFKVAGKIYYIDANNKEQAKQFFFENYVTCYQPQENKEV